MRRVRGAARYVDGRKLWREFLDVVDEALGGIQHSEGSGAIESADADRLREMVEDVKAGIGALLGVAPRFPQGTRTGRWISSEPNTSNPPRPLLVHDEAPASSTEEVADTMREILPPLDIVDDRKTCEACGGSGEVDTPRPPEVVGDLEECKACGGRGEVDPPGPLSVPSICGACGGDGRT